MPGSKKCDYVFIDFHSHIGIDNKDVVIVNIDAVTKNVQPACCDYFPGGIENQ